MWNIVLRKFIEIKNEFSEKFGSEKLWEYETGDCLSYWVKMLEKEEYEILLAPLRLTEYNGFLLIRYIFIRNPLMKTKEDFWDLFGGFYMECRSVVIDIKNDELALCPFRKFRNINECPQNSIENIKKRIENASCVEFSDKLDGSMQSARWYKGKVLMSGSKALNPDNSFGLKDGYKMIYENKSYVQFLKDNPDYTAVFEYISLKDQHMVIYSKEQEGLYLVGMRNVITGDELPYNKVIAFAEKYGLLTTALHNLTLDKLMASLDSKKSNEAEGFVLNIDGYKVKVKYNDYTSMCGILNVLVSPNLVIQTIADDTWDDFISKIPSGYKDRVQGLADKVFDYQAKMESILCAYHKKLMEQNLKTRKENMLWIKNNVPKKYRGLVQCKYLGKTYNLLSPREYQYKKMDEIEHLLKTYQEEYPS